MAEPAHRLDDDQPKGIYDEATGTAPSDPRPQLRALEGGGQTTPRQTDHLKPVEDMPSNGLSLAETGASQPYENQVGSGYKRVDSPKKLSLRGLATKRNGLYAGGIGGVIIAVFLSMFAVGPLQLVHLSQVLQHPFSKQESDSSNRLGKMFRYAKSGNFGETRVGLLGSHFFGSTIDDLNKVGVDIKTNSVGRPVETTFDTEKLKANFPELGGMSQEEVKSFLADKMNASAADFQTRQVNTGGTVTTEYYIDQSEYDLKALRFQTKGTASLLDDGRIATALKGRLMTKFFGLPSLFHPFQSWRENKINEIINAREKAAAQQQEEQQREIAAEPEQVAEGVTAAKDIESKTGTGKTLIRGLTAVSGACLVRSVSGEIVKINHDLVVLPAEAKAADAVAIGAQIESGQDLTEEQALSFGKSLENTQGQTVWKGQALQSLATNGKTDGSLTDLPPDYRQAFSPKTTASAIEGTTTQILNYAPGGATVICSAPVQITIGLAQILGSLAAEVGSLGTLTPAVAASWAADEATSQLATMTALHFLDNFIMDKSTYKLANDAFSGPVGGDLLAFGARASANTIAIASGGISLANNATTIVSAQDQQQYQSMSIAQKLFDPYDSRSAVASMIDSASPSLLQNISGVGSFFTNFGSMFRQPFSAIMPHAIAADQPYNWGFPQYGIPDSILNDPNLDNPYANASYVAGLLKRSGQQIYQKRVGECFGVSFTQVDDGSGHNIWDVIPKSEVNPSEASYADGNCNDSNEDWHRIIMFIFDTTTMKAAACYQGDDQSCADLGAGSESAPTANPAGDNSGGTSTSTGGSIPSGSAQDLAKQLLPYLSDGKLKCNSLSGNIGCSDITNTAKGVSIKGGQGCQVDSLDPQLLGMLLKLLQMNHTFTLSAICSDHHDDGLSEHAGGKAADFNIIDGVFMGPSASEPWDSEKLQAAQKLDQDIVAFMPAGSVGFGQVGVNSSGATCHAPFSFMSGYSTYPDDCHHQHVQVLK